MWEVVEDVKLKGQKQKNDERKVDFHHRIQRMDKVRIDNMNAMDSAQRIIMAAVANENKDLDFQEKQKLARELILSPKGVKIKIQDKEIAVEDLQFRIATSIEMINSETNTQNEYFDWIENGHDIIRKMNDGTVEPHELKERNEFLNNLDQREAELMTCLSLYRNSATPAAKQKYEELYNKLQKLREIKSAIRTTTKDTADKEKITSKEEYNKALAYWLTIGEVQKAVYENNRKKEDVARKKLQSQLFRDGGHAADEMVFAQEIDDYWRAMQHEAKYADRSPTEYLILSKNEHRGKENIAKYINSLRGRRTVAQEMAEEREKIEKQRKIFDKWKQNGFDGVRFAELEKTNEYQRM